MQMYSVTLMISFACSKCDHQMSVLIFLTEVGGAIGTGLEKAGDVVGSGITKAGTSLF